MMRIIILLLSFGLVFSLSACDEKQPNNTKVVKPRAVVKKPVEAEKKETVVVAPKFVYVAGERRDPFTSLLEVRNPLQEDSEPQTPLQQFGLKELRLSAIVVGKGEPRALVVAPDKKAYLLNVGVKIGRNHGVVTDITEDVVIVEERFRDFSGGLRTEIQKITLPNREGE
ncbi:MAG: pilus assembly protein PilP [Desulfuromonas sp.]|nr:pilus assembly protein PilP [Desulfuromonas sp.]